MAEGVHAVVMVKGGVHTVYPDSVDRELLEEGYITGASSRVDERVDERVRLGEGVVRIG